MPEAEATGDCSPAAIDALTRDLAKRDPQVRAAARSALLDCGRQATPQLIALLTHRNSGLRWEAAKTLSALGDPEATDALINALDDAQQGVRWLAAQGLISIGTSSVPPLLRVLLTQADHIGVREGAHHVFVSLRGRVPNDLLRPVITALDSLTPTIDTPLAAFRALDALRDAAR